jgi:hypothetical protein
MDSIDYDYEQFGNPRQFHVLRALAFDQVTRKFLVDNPTASVVAGRGPPDQLLATASEWRPGP